MKKIEIFGRESLLGRWRIVRMRDFEPEDFNEDGPAYLEIKRGGRGEFRFCLVSGSIDGSFKKTPDGLIFDFTWIGSDECDEACGDGWLKAAGGRSAEGEIRFHGGDVCRFWAVRSSGRPAGSKRGA